MGPDGRLGNFHDPQLPELLVQTTHPISQVATLLQPTIGELLLQSCVLLQLNHALFPSRHLAAQLLDFLFLTHRLGLMLQDRLSQLAHLGWVGFNILGRRLRILGTGLSGTGGCLRLFARATGIRRNDSPTGCLNSFYFELPGHLASIVPLAGRRDRGSSHRHTRLVVLDSVQGSLQGGSRSALPLQLMR